MRTAGLALAIATAGCSGNGQGSINAAFTAASQVPHLTSLAVREDGAVVREVFFNGADPTTLHDVRSVTKTVTSLLIGSALQAGCLTSVDQTLGDVLGDQAPSDPAKAAIPLRALLSMSSGFDWHEDGSVGDYNTWAAAPNQVEYVLARPLVETPGARFNYDSGALHLLSVAITQACGPTLDFAAGGLFAALGITSRTWETDNQGNANGAAGLQLTTADLEQLGELIRSGGTVGDARVVPADYLGDAMSAQVSTGDVADRTPSYGYGMWLGDGIVLAEGYGGQFIIVVPDKHAVVVATTDWLGLSSVADTDYDQLYTVLLNDVLPAL